MTKRNLVCLLPLNQDAGVQEALGKLLTLEHMSSSMKLLTLQGQCGNIIKNRTHSRKINSIVAFRVVIDWGTGDSEEIPSKILGYFKN